MLETGSSRLVANALASVVRPQGTVNWVVLVPASAGGIYLENILGSQQGAVHTSGAQPADDTMNEGVRLVPALTQMNKLQIIIPPNTAVWVRSTTTSGDAVFIAHYRAL